MYNENNTLSPAKIELISNVSGAYSAPFWDGLREVTGTLDTVRKIKAVLKRSAPQVMNAKPTTLFLQYTI